MSTPKIHLVAWLDRPGKFIFVAIPDQVGRYVRTDKSVAVVACPYCKSAVGEPCKGRQGYGGGTHHHRRKAAYWKPDVDDVLDKGAVPEEWLEAAS